MNKILPLLSLLLIAACADKPLDDRIGTVGNLYNDGMDLLEQGDYLNSAHTFEELERQHPYSGWATKAQMMSAYAQYRQGEYATAVEIVDRFMSLHPGHKDADYMLYLKGMSYYSRISNVKRDQGFTRDALNVFEELERRFPNSEYAKDSRLKVTLCYDHLAGKDMTVGRFYQQQKRYLAAINRFKDVVKKYEKSTHTPEALFRLTESYAALGLHDEARRNAAVLGHNFGASKWYQKAYSLLEERQLAPAGQEKSWYQKFSNSITEIF